MEQGLAIFSGEKKYNIYICLYILSIYKQNLFIKNCLFILTCLNVSHLQSTLHLMQYTYQDLFPLLKTILELIDFDAF